MPRPGESVGLGSETAGHAGGRELSRSGGRRSARAGAGLPRPRRRRHGPARSRRSDPRPGRPALCRRRPAGASRLPHRRGDGRGTIAPGRGRDRRDRAPPPPAALPRPGPPPEGRGAAGAADLGHLPGADARRGGGIAAGLPRPCPGLDQPAPCAAGRRALRLRRQHRRDPRRRGGNAPGQCDPGPVPGRCPRAGGGGADGGGGARPAAPARWC